MKDGSPELVRRVSGEIDALRGDIGNLVAELDRRRHEMFDLRLQARRHPVVVAAAAAGAALVLGGLVAYAVREGRERRRPIRRAREVRRAMSRLMEHPYDVAAKPNVAEKILMAAGVAAGTALAKRIVERAVATAPRSAPRAAAAAPAPP
jgi:hypothetical protein